MNQPSPSTNLGLLAFRMQNVWLVQAASRSEAKGAQIFLQLPGINVDFKDGNGRTALHYAAKKGLEGLAEALLNKGANRTITDAAGDTPLALAERNKHQDIVDLLRSK
jgi:hypothetical protein